MGIVFLSKANLAREEWLVQRGYCENGSINKKDIR